MIALLSILLGFVLFSLFFTKANEGTKSVKQRIKSLNRPNKVEDIVRYESEKLDRPLYERLFLPIVQNIGNLITKITPGNLYAIAVEKKIYAGRYYRWSPASFVLLWFLSAVGMLFWGIYYYFVLKTNISFLQSFLSTVFAFAIGAYLPILIMNILIKKRRDEILRQLPEMLDLVCVSVQAGLSFDGALAKVTEYMEGPLVDECRKMLQEVKMGMTRKEALGNLAQRCQLQEMSLFTAAIIQSDRLGVALAKTLVIQSGNMRERRRQTVKATALKAPVKIIIPLVIFVFPAIFIVALVPSLLTLSGK